MKITQKLVRETIKSNSQKLHPKSWHDFQQKPEVISVNFALMQYENRTKDMKDIVEKAKSYFEDIYCDN